eukprot:Anaeramoba_ignava/a490927_8.p1 GENE.a490927_8~~a490927_8.p1  ORF type:complete len:187 (-),score=-0.04 a490927_8:303-863(-)
MYKKTIIGSLLICSSVFFSACSSKEEVYTPNKVEGECIINGEKAPMWVCGSYENPLQYTDVGSAPLSKLGHNFSRNEALANGRNNLVNQIELEIKNKTESYMRSTGIGENEMVERVIKQVSKQTSSMVLNNSKQISYWQNPADKTIFLLVAVDKADVDGKIDAQVKEIVENDQQIKNAKEELDSLK